MIITRLTKEKNIKKGEKILLKEKKKTKKGGSGMQKESKTLKAKIIKTDRLHPIKREKPILGLT